jgi:hypothetical protein
MILCEGLRRAGEDLTTERLIDALEGMNKLDLGLGAAVTFGPSDHQAINKVWGTKLDEKFKYQSLDLDE